MRRLRALLIAGLLVVSACSASGLTIDAEVVGGSTDSDRDDDTAAVDVDPDDVVQLALDDLATYWTERLPEVYDTEFTPLTGGLVPYGPNTAVPQCGEQPIIYEDIAANALYCPDEDLIAWDRVNLTPGLQESYGPLTVGIVMAHEYAHAIQLRGGVRGAVVTLELQADCFAGAWVGDVDDRIDVFNTDGDSLDQAVGGFLELRDTIGVAASDPNAHGSGFDRVSAFQEGFDVGPEACTTYEDDPPPVVALPFRSIDDLDAEGNMPVDELVPLLLTDLESFYEALFTDEAMAWEPIGGLVPFDPSADDVDCGSQELTREDLERASFYCVPDATIYIDNVDLVPSLDAIGDFAVGGEIARQYAFAAQDQLGILDRYDDTELHADCLTGVYASAQFLESIPDQQLFLSPGDLDEIIIAFLAFGGAEDASAFERTASFRSGFVDGFDECEAFLG